MVCTAFKTSNKQSLFRAVHPQSITVGSCTVWPWCSCTTWSCVVRMGWWSVIRCLDPPLPTCSSILEERLILHLHTKSLALQHTMDISAEIWKLLHNIQPLQWIDAPSGLNERCWRSNICKQWNGLECYSTLRATPSALFLARGPFSSNILYWVDVLNSALIVAAQTWQKTCQQVFRSDLYSGLHKKQMIRFNLAEMTGFWWRNLPKLRGSALSTRIYAPSTHEKVRT